MKFTNVTAFIYIETLAIITLFSTNYDDKGTYIFKQSIYNAGHGFIIGSYFVCKMICEKN